MEKLKLNKTKNSKFNKVANLRKVIDLELKKTYRTIDEQNEILGNKELILPKFSEQTFSSSSKCILIIIIIILANQSLTYTKPTCNHYSPNTNGINCLNTQSAAIQKFVDFSSEHIQIRKNSIIEKKRSKQVDGISKRYNKKLLRFAFLIVLI